MQLFFQELYLIEAGLDNAVISGDLLGRQFSLTNIITRYSFDGPSALLVFPEV
jgi:hypothetical protein